jgi:hypothetical protein
VDRGHEAPGIALVELTGRQEIVGNASPQEHGLATPGHLIGQSEWQRC